VCALLLLFFGRPALSKITTFIASPFYSIQKYIQTSSATIPIFIRSRSELAKEIDTLKNEIESQKGVQQSLLYITEENKELRSLLNASNTPSILASIIARPPHTPYDTVVIDQGSMDGIVEASPVFYGTGLALGYVKKSLPHHAFVTLFSSPGAETTVYVFGPNIFTTAYGEGGGVIRLSIPHGILVKEGDVIILPSLTTGVLGTVSSVVSIPSEPAQNVYSTFEIPMQSIHTVRVAQDQVTQMTFEEASAQVEDVYKTRFMIDIPPDMQAFTPVDSASSSGTSTTQVPDNI
jgi:cell shape-determining protein MreC